MIVMSVSCQAYDGRTEPLEDTIRKHPSPQRTLEHLILHPHIHEAIILSTCHRFQVFVLIDSKEPYPENLILEHLNVQTSQRAAWTSTIGAHATAQHLFRLVCGLESPIIGECEIQGQIRIALDIATEKQTTGPILTRLFMTTLATGKRIRHKTKIGEGPISLSFLASQIIAQRVNETPESHHVIMIGSGYMGRSLAKNMKASGIKELTLLGRESSPHLKALADELHLKYQNIDSLQHQLLYADVIICATTAKEPLITHSMIANSTRTKPLLLVDLSRPANIEESTDNISYVTRYGITRLSKQQHETYRQRKESIPHAEKLIQEDLVKWNLWIKTRHISRHFGDLGDEFEIIRMSIMNELTKKVDINAIPHIDIATKSLIGRIKGIVARTFREEKNITYSINHHEP